MFVFIPPAAIAVGNGTFSAKKRKKADRPPGLTGTASFRRPVIARQETIGGQLGSDRLRYIALRKAATGQKPEYPGATERKRRRSAGRTCPGLTRGLTNRANWY